MGRRKYTKRPGLVILLATAGLLQVILVIFGCFWLAEHFGEAYPFLLYLRQGAGFAGLLSLVYPAYIAGALDHTG